MEQAIEVSLEELIDRSNLKENFEHELSLSKNCERSLIQTEDEKDLKEFWFHRLKKGLLNTGKSFGSFFSKKSIEEINEDFFDELEYVLIRSDSGIETAQLLISLLRKEIKERSVKDVLNIKNLLRILIINHLQILEKEFHFSDKQPLVITFSGVNGVGKTTSIGKLAHLLQNKGISVLLASGDTYRAGAKEQLKEWADYNRNGNVVFYCQDNRNPSAIAFDAIKMARKNGIQTVLLDTSGRLPTQTYLMEEIKKINRVIKKATDGAYHENILVVDGNTGQNSIQQVKSFNDAINLTGLIITKLDGTAKGGVLLSLASSYKNLIKPIPVYWIGMGENLQDLQPFSANSFTSALFPD